MDLQNQKLIDNPGLQRFEFHIQEQVAVADYSIDNQNRVRITHVGVPKILEHRGIASALMKAVLHNLEARKMKVVPICSFAVAYIERHPEWKKLL